MRKTGVMDKKILEKPCASCGEAISSSYEYVQCGIGPLCNNCVIITFPGQWGDAASELLLCRGTCYPAHQAARTLWELE